MSHTLAPASVSAVAQLPPEGRAALRGGVFGNYVDQLHIFLPLVALAPALATLAGPHAAATTGALVVMAMLLGRPIGGMVFGHIADRIGRTATTKLAIAGTALCSFGIAAVPSHDLIGAAAISLVLLLRFLGGIFIAGEYSAAIPLAMEWSKPRRRGLFSGLIMSMAPWAQATIAFVTGAMLVLLGPSEYAQWGWRASFVAGGLASVGMLLYYRRHVTDAPVFHRHRARRGPGLRGILTGGYAPAFWQMFGLMTGLWFLTNTTVIMLAPRLSTDVGLGSTTASIVMGCAAVGQAVVMGITGHLSTLLGRRRFFVIWGALATVSAPLLWLTIMGGPATWVVALSAVALQVLTVTAYGPIGAYLSERFPTAVRSTGYGTAYSLSIIVPALYPFYLPTLQGWWGHDGAVVVMMVLGGTLVAVCGAIGPALRPRETSQDLETVSEAMAR